MLKTNAILLNPFHVFQLQVLLETAWQWIRRRQGIV